VVVRFSPLLNDEYPANPGKNQQENLALGPVCHGLWFEGFGARSQRRAEPDNQVAEEVIH
jgi:hypothetical protein